MARTGRNFPARRVPRRPPYNPTKVIVAASAPNGGVAPAAVTIKFVQSIVITSPPSSAASSYDSGTYDNTGITYDGAVSPPKPTIVTKAAVTTVTPSTGSVSPPTVVTKVVVTANSAPNGGVAPGSVGIQQPTHPTQLIFTSGIPTSGSAPGNPAIFETGVLQVITEGYMPLGGVAPLAVTIVGGGVQNAFILGTSDNEGDSLEGGIQGGPGVVRAIVPSSIPNGGVAPQPPTIVQSRQFINVAGFPVTGSVPKPALVTKIAVTAASFPVTGNANARPAITTSSAGARVGASFGSTGSIALSSVSVVLPSTLLANDFILIAVANNSVTGLTWATPAGYTALPATTTPDGIEVQQIFFKRAVSGDIGATVTFTLPSAALQVAGAVCYRSIDPTKAFVPSTPTASAAVTAVGVAANALTNTNALNPGVTSSTLVAFASTVSTGAGSIATSITGGVAVGEIATTGPGGNVSLAISDQFLANPSANTWAFTQNAPYSGSVILLAVESTRVAAQVIVPASKPNGGVAPGNPAIVTKTGPFIVTSAAQTFADTASPSTSTATSITTTSAKSLGSAPAPGVAATSVGVTVTTSAAQTYGQANALVPVAVTVSVTAGQVFAQVDPSGNVNAVIINPPTEDAIRQQLLQLIQPLHFPSSIVETVITQVQGQTSLSVAFSQAVFDPLGLAKEKTIATVDIYQEEKAHDICIISVRGEDSTSPEFATGTPVHVRYGWGPSRVEDFYGYVNHVEPPYMRQVYGQSAYYMDVVLVGASYVFKNGFSKIFTDTKASTVVEQLSNSNYFASLVETDDGPWDQLSCPGISGWEFLVELADRLGWLVMCNKSQIRFMSYDRALARNSTVVPTFRTKNSASLSSQETISSFNVLQGETVPNPSGTKALRVVSGVDPRLSKPYTVQNDASGLSIIGNTTTAPIFTAMHTDIVTSDSISAQQQVDSATQSNRFHIQAQAVVNGDPSVTQGIPVILLGIDSNSDGVWYVEKVIHHLEFMSYTMTLTLGRDSHGDSGYRSKQSPIVSWSLLDPYATNNIIPPQTILVNGRWRAASQSVQELVGT